MNLFQASLVQGDAGLAVRVRAEDRQDLFTLALPAGARWAGMAAGQALVLGLRPHRVRVGDAHTDSLTPGLQATLVSQHWLGDQSHLGLMLGDSFVTVVADRDLALTVDTRIGLQIPINAVHLFDAGSTAAVFHGPNLKRPAAARV